MIKQYRRYEELSISRCLLLDNEKKNIAANDNEISQIRRAFVHAVTM